MSFNSTKLLALRGCLGMLMMVAGCEQAETQVKSPPPPPVNVMTPVQREVQEYDQFTGRVAPLKTVEVRSHVAGFIQKVNFQDGSDVTAGQLLIEIDPKPFEAYLAQANAKKQQATAEKDYADRELARIAPLVPTGGASQLELSKAQDAVARGKASIAAAEAEIQTRQLDLDYASVKSPIDGRVSKTNFTVGNLVGGDTVLTSVVSIHPINVNIDMDERRLQMYREIGRKTGVSNPANISVLKIPMSVALVSEKDFPHAGTIDFVDNQVDALTGTIRVRGLFDNTARLLIPGQFVQSRIPRGDPTKELLVPDRAVGHDQDRKFLLIVDDKNVVENRSVETGGLFGDERAITSGLKAGERVIVDGTQRARSGQAVTPTVVQPATQPATQPK